MHINMDKVKVEIITRSFHRQSYALNLSLFSDNAMAGLWPDPQFLIVSSLFLQVTRTTIKYRISSKSEKIRSRTAELAALERLENHSRSSFLMDLFHSCK